MASTVQWQDGTTVSAAGSVEQLQCSGSIAMSGKQFARTRGTATTGGAAVGLGAVGAVGRLQVNNLDTTIVLLISGDGGSTYPFKIGPGESFSGRLAGSALWVKSASATVDYDALLVEN